MEFFITLQDGFGDGILAEPAAIIEVAQNWEPEKLDLTGRATLREDGENSLFIEGGYQWHEQIRFHINVEDAPGEQPDYRESITINVGAEIDMGVGAITVDASPNAYREGKRFRIGAKSEYQFTPRVFATTHLKYRYLGKQDTWEPQVDVTVNYKLNQNATVFVSHKEHDFFDDATIIGYKLRAF